MYTWFKKKNQQKGLSFTPSYNYSSVDSDSDNDSTDFTQIEHESMRGNNTMKDAISSISENKSTIPDLIQIVYINLLRK